MELIIDTPISTLSLGQVGYNLLKECFRRNYKVGWFPVGETDLSPFKVVKEFHQWLQESINQRWDLLKKDTVCLKNWHIQGSENLRTNRQILLTYHETNRPTDVEKSIVNLQHKTLFCGGYSEKIFKEAGCENVSSFNLGFDNEFHTTDRKYLNTISWSLGGAKFEHRKFTARIINLWVKKYGNNRNHSLNLLVYNPFFSPEDNQRLVMNAMDGKRFFNVNILPRLKTNDEINQLINATDIDLTGIGGNEAFGIPAFMATALGKWSVVTASAGNLSWATEENSIMIRPSGMMPSHDGVFFKNGADFSQGEFFNVSDEEIIRGMEIAEKKAGQLNEVGLRLQTSHTWAKTLDQIISHF